MNIGLALPNVKNYSETFFKSKIEGLSQTGFNVVILSTGRYKRHQSENSFYKVVYPFPVNRILVVNLITIPFSIFWLFLRYPIKCFRYLKSDFKNNKKFTSSLINLYSNGHILSQNLDWLHFGYITLAVNRENIANAMGAKMAVSLRGADICLRPLKDPDIFDSTWEKVDKVHYISSDLLKRAEKLGFKRDTASQKITPAINTRNFTIENLKPINKEHLSILTVARLHWKKGLDYAIQAMHLLDNKGLEFSYTIVGEGDQFDRLCFQIHQLGLNKKVHLVGSVDHSEVVNYLSKSDIFLMPSLSEGFCNAVLEAQSMGLLCIVSDAEGLSENVIDEETGWVVPKRSSEAISKKIKEVINYPIENLDGIRERAVKRVNDDFNLKKHSLEWEKFYNE